MRLSMLHCLRLSLTVGAQSSNGAALQRDEGRGEAASKPEERYRTLGHGARLSLYCQTPGRGRLDRELHALSLYDII